MKTSWFLFAFLIPLFILSGCTHTIYTHQQVLQKCLNKVDVLKRFGQPDEKIPGEGMEQWVYKMSKWPAAKTDSIKNRPDSLASDSARVPEEKYVKFMFDDQGKVMGYKTSGVDLTRSEKDNFGKSFVTITGGVFVVSLWVVIELAKAGAFNN
jgi:hypothetical protein